MEGNNVWFSNYAWRPGQLFDRVTRALSIFICRPNFLRKGNCYATCYQKWNAEQRSLIFESVTYGKTEKRDYWIPKISYAVENELIRKIQSQEQLAKVSVPCGDKIYYRTTGGLYWKVFTDFSPYFKCNGLPGHSSRETYFSVAGIKRASILCSILLSDFFWYWYSISSNLRDLNPSDIMNFYIPATFESESSFILAKDLLSDMCNNSIPLVRNQKGVGVTETQSFRIKKSKDLINQVDTMLANLYSLNEGELDFIVSYDIKFRMGDSEDD